MNEIIPSDGKEVLKAIVGFRTSLEAVESHIYVSIPVVYKVVSKIEQNGITECLATSRHFHSHPFLSRSDDPTAGLNDASSIHVSTAKLEKTQRQTMTKPSHLRMAVAPLLLNFPLKAKFKENGACSMGTRVLLNEDL